MTLEHCKAQVSSEIATREKAEADLRGANAKIAGELEEECLPLAAAVLTQLPSLCASTCRVSLHIRFRFLVGLTSELSEAHSGAVAMQGRLTSTNTALEHATRELVTAHETVCDCCMHRVSTAAEALCVPSPSLPSLPAHFANDIASPAPPTGFRLITNCRSLPSPPRYLA